MVPLILLLSLGLPTSGALSQPGRQENAHDSIYWVTLSDEITPPELKRLRTDPEAIRERYQLAVQRGAASPELDPRRLITFVDPRENPELVAMHEAFQLFAVGFTDQDLGAELQVLVADRFAQDGTSPAGSKRIVEAMREFRTRLDQENDQLFPVRQRIERILQDVHNRMPYDAAEKLIAGASAQAKKGNVAAVAALLKIPRDAAQDMVDFVAVDTGRNAVAPVLKELRDELAIDDWNNLRDVLESYVRESVGMMMEVEPR